jgi:CRISPR system Cascade subunit CasA
MDEGGSFGAEAKFDLLTEQLIRTVRNDRREERLSLPQILAGCAADRIASFPALRAHQAPAWRAFLVQTAVMGIEVLGLSQAPGDDAEAWADVLRALTPECADTAWSLVGPPSRPAFFQPPVSDLSAYLGEVATPDALDVLVTSKNHDAKAERLFNAREDDWVFALVSLQTQEGFMGAGNFGIARMNGGFGSRPYLMLRAADGGGFWAGFRRDVDGLLAQRAKWMRAAEQRGFDLAQGVRLLWTKPWDGKGQFTIDQLHPLFVEICRRVRLEIRDGAIIAKTASSSASRIAAKDLNGNLDDPWGAVNLGDAPKMLSMTSGGFGYRRMVQLLFGDTDRKYRRGILAQPQPSEKNSDLILEAFALARGQGKTEGFHTRSVFIPGRQVPELADADLGAAHRLAEIANARVQMAGETWLKALRTALIVLTQKGPAEPAWKKPANEPMTRDAQTRFDALVDEAFFPALWRDVDLGTDEARERAWALDLAHMARKVFAQAVDAAPRSDARRIIAHARAANMLEGGLHTALPSLRNAKPENADVVDRT